MHAVGSTIGMPANQICYSDKYCDDTYEYRYVLRLGGGGAACSLNAKLTHRHVILPKDVAATIPKGQLLDEREWRKLGVQQSRGWVHYMVHRPG